MSSRLFLFVCLFCFCLGFIRSTQQTSGSPALPRKQRDKSPSGLLEDTRETTFTRDRKGGFFSSFMKKKNAPTPPKRSSSFREMENQAHKKYELTGNFSGVGPLQHIDGFSFAPSQQDGNLCLSKCYIGSFAQRNIYGEDGGGGGGSGGTSIGSGWSGLTGFFTPRLIKKTFGLRAGRPTGGDETSKPFPRSNSTSSMSAGLPDQERMAMTLPRNCHRSKVQLERTVSTSSEPEENTDKSNDLLPKRCEDIHTLTRSRPKAKLLPRGATAVPLRTPPVDTSVLEKDCQGPTAAASLKSKEKNSGMRQGSVEGEEKPGWPSPAKAAAILPTTHNHKVPVLISPTLKHTPAEVQLIGTDSQGNRFKLLSEHQSTASSDRDRPRRIKPKCAPPPPPPPPPPQAVLRLLHQPPGTSDTVEELDNGALVQHGQDSEGSKKVTVAPTGGKAGRPVIPPPQVPLPLSSSPAKMANGTAGVAKVALRKTKQTAERISADKISKEALLECADLLSSAIAEPTTNSQLVDTGHQLLDYCSGYVDCIPQTRNKFAFREAVSKLELSLQELQVSSMAANLPGANPVLNNLLSCVQEISDVVQR